MAGAFVNSRHSLLRLTNNSKTFVQVLWIHDCPPAGLFYYDERFGYEYTSLAGKSLLQPLAFQSEMVYWNH